MLISTSHYVHGVSVTVELAEDAYGYANLFVRADDGISIAAIHGLGLQRLRLLVGQAELAIEHLERQQLSHPTGE